MCGASAEKVARLRFCQSSTPYAGHRVMRRRRGWVAIAAVVVTAPNLAFAQKPAKIYRIGILVASARPTAIAESLSGVLRTNLRELGYVEGKSLVIEERYAGASE